MDTASPTPKAKVQRRRKVRRAGGPVFRRALKQRTERALFWTERALLLTEMAIWVTAQLCHIWSLRVLLFGPSLATPDKGQGASMSPKKAPRQLIPDCGMLVTTAEFLATKRQQEAKRPPPFVPAFTRKGLHPQPQPSTSAEVNFKILHLLITYFYV